MNRDNALLLAFILILIGALGVCNVTESRADFPDLSTISRRDPALVIAMMFEGEGGGERDARAMVNVLRNRREAFPALRNASIVAVARGFSSPIRFNVAPTDRRAAVRARSWSQILHYRPWARKLAEDAVAERPIEDPCAGDAFDWGSAQDTRALTHLVVDCGETANTFLARARWRRGVAIEPLRVLPARLAAGT